MASFTTHEQLTDASSVHASRTAAFERRGDHNDYKKKRIFMLYLSLDDIDCKDDDPIRMTLSCVCVSVTEVSYDHPVTLRSKLIQQIQRTRTLRGHQHLNLSLQKVMLLTAVVEIILPAIVSRIDRPDTSGCRVRVVAVWFSRKFYGASNCNRKPDHL